MRLAACSSVTAPLARDVLETVERDTLYQQFQPLVRWLISRYGSDPELREDLPGEIYCRFCRLLDEYDPRRGVPVVPYLIRRLTLSTYSFTRSHWRLRNREHQYDLDRASGVAEDRGDPSDLWDEQMQMRDVLQQLPRALCGLPPRQRQVTIARYYEGRSFDEIAQKLGIRAGTARAILRQALGNLRRRVVLPDADVIAERPLDGAGCRSGGFGHRSPDGAPGIDLKG